MLHAIVNVCVFVMQATRHKKKREKNVNRRFCISSIRLMSDTPFAMLIASAGYKMVDLNKLQIDQGKCTILLLSCYVSRLNVKERRKNRTILPFHINEILFYPIEN